MIFSLKIPLYPTDEQKIYMHSMSDICHKMQNTAVSHLKHNDDFIDESSLRNYLLDKVALDLPVSFIANVVAKEKHRAYMKFGSERLNFIRYSYVSKSFPVRCDANSGRLSRIYLKGDCIKIPSIDGFVVISRNWLRKNSDLVGILNGKKQSARVIFDGKYWYLVFSYNTEAASIELKDKVIGVDLGIKTLVVTSDNEFKDGVHKERVYKSIVKRIKGLQRKLSRKYVLNNQGYKKSNKIRKLEHKISLLNRRLRNIRINRLHNVSKFLVDKRYKMIAFETLNIKGMIRNRKLSKAIASQGWYNLIQFTKYKAEFYGEQLKQIGRFEASSKLCSRCGSKKQDLTLKDRIYICNECGLVIDRDYNAALNIRNIALSSN